MPLQRYVCHKEVLAAKISVVRERRFSSGGQSVTEGGVLVFAGADSCPVSAEYLAKHKPQPGGYYVRYADGYESFSPAAPFEAGYTCVEGKQDEDR